jgi:hypothetical protein
MQNPNGATAPDLRELTAAELEAVGGGMAGTLNFGLFEICASLTKDGFTGGIKIGDGPWHGGTIWFH